jgi:hypothetical protein
VLPPQRALCPEIPACAGMTERVSVDGEVQGGLRFPPARE